jgi:hypothetical protein
VSVAHQLPTSCPPVAHQSPTSCVCGLVGIR